MAAWLAGAVEAGTPVLGICYGHQLLAHGLGGRVGANPRGREIGSVDERLHAAAREDALFGAFPERLVVQATHVESALELPGGARLLGSSPGTRTTPWRSVRRRGGCSFIRSSTPA